jgi:hypothetical protein
MAEHPNHLEEVGRLAGLLLEGELGPPDRRRLEEMLLADHAALEYYQDYVDVHCLLHWQHGQADVGSVMELPDACSAVDLSDVGSAVELPDRSGEIPNPIPFIPPIILDLSPAVRHSIAAQVFSPGGFLFSYTMSALIVGIALLVGWTWKIHYDRQLDRDVSRQDGNKPPSPMPASQATPIGQITGMVDCRWADPRTEAFDRDAVPLGRKYALQSGFIEITYNTGAKIILQGPAAYEVESASGGFLSLGKLTARVEMGEERREKGESSMVSGQRSVFSVRTPTAIVTDLGTEFGVEVDRSGASRAYVFRGKVELQPTPGDKPGPAVQLGANESARVEMGKGRGAKVIREAGRSNARAFARQMPKPNPFKLFNTGVGVNEGDPDPHWQVVARSDDPSFTPRPAVVTAVGPNYLANDPAEAQWISLSNGPPELPNGVTCTFRTTFEIRGAKPTDPMPDLGGRFGFGNDTRMIAARVNGKDAYAPKDASGLPSAGKRWVEGINYVELDVANKDPSHGAGTSVILLRVVWH